MEAMRPFQQTLSQRIGHHMQALSGDFGGFPVDRLTHCTQTATRALEHGEDEEYVVCALLHDIGDTLGTYNHPDLAATILEPFDSEGNHWMVQQHGLFQGYYFFHHFGVDPNLRERYRAHPHFERTERFVRLYDAPSFDARYPSLPMQDFVPLVARVFARPRKIFYAELKLTTEGDGPR